MYKFACKDLGLDCSFQTTGATIEEVKNKAMAHARVTHADMLSKLSPKQMADMDVTMTSKIK